MALPDHKCSTGLLDGAQHPDLLGAHRGDSAALGDAIRRRRMAKGNGSASWTGTAATHHSCGGSSLLPALWQQWTRDLDNVMVKLELELRPACPSHCNSEWRCSTPKSRNGLGWHTLRNTFIRIGAQVRHFHFSSCSITPTQ